MARSLAWTPGVSPRASSTVAECTKVSGTGERNQFARPRVSEIYIDGNSGRRYDFGARAGSYVPCCICSSFSFDEKATILCDVVSRIVVSV